MRKTEHYQLNQWEKTDRILMEDFNGDNAKLDAALAALRALSASESARLEGALAAAQNALNADIQRLDAGKLRFDVLLEQSVTASGDASLNLPVNGALLSQCALAAVDIQLPSFGNCCLGFNGSLGGYWTPSIPSGTSSGGLAMLTSGRLSRLLFFPMKRGGAPVTCFMAGGGIYLGYTIHSYNNLNYLQLREVNGNSLTGTVGLRVAGIL